MRRLAALGLLLAATPAVAQRSELGLLAGYTTPGSLDERAAGIQGLEAGGGFSWGVQAGRFFTPHLGAEISWARQQGAQISTASGSAELFDMNVGLLHGSLVWQLGAEQARLRPFLFAGLGASFFSARGLEGETKLSFGLGAGFKWFPRKGLGLRLQARYEPTLLNDAASDYCDPFGFCQGSLQQLEIMGGVVLRF